MLVFRGVRCYWDVWNETWFCFLKLFLAPSWLSGKWDASNRTCSLISGNTPAKFNISPLKICRPQKERVVLQASFFRGELLNFRGCIPLKWLWAKWRYGKSKAFFRLSWLITFCWLEKSVSQNLGLADRKNPGLCLIDEHSWVFWMASFPSKWRRAVLVVTSWGGETRTQPEKILRLKLGDASGKMFGESHESLRKIHLWITYGNPLVIHRIHHWWIPP